MLKLFLYYIKSKHFYMVYSGNCGRRICQYQLNATLCPTPCSNLECTTKSAKTNYELTFDFIVSIADATGTLTQCRLKGQQADGILQTNVKIVKI